MKHYFLTGDIQVGKSTLLRKCLKNLGLWKNEQLGGFLTVAGNPETEGGNYIHLIPADFSEPLSAENIVFARSFSNGQRRFRVYEHMFNNRGRELINEGASKKMILMDEIGTAEANCEAFRDAILQALNGTVPVVGVVQIREGGFLDEIRNHPNVIMIRVTKENRSILYQSLLFRLKSLV